MRDMKKVRILYLISQIMIALTCVAMLWKSISVIPAVGAVFAIAGIVFTICDMVGYHENNLMKLKRLIPIIIIAVLALNLVNIEGFWRRNYLDIPYYHYYYYRQETVERIIMAFFGTIFAVISYCVSRTANSRLEILPPPSFFDTSASKLMGNKIKPSTVFIAGVIALTVSALIMVAEVAVIRIWMY